MFKILLFFCLCCLLVQKSEMMLRGLGRLVSKKGNNGSKSSRELNHSRSNNRELDMDDELDIDEDEDGPSIPQHTRAAAASTSNTSAGAKNAKKGNKSAEKGKKPTKKKERRAPPPSPPPPMEATTDCAVCLMELDKDAVEPEEITQWLPCTHPFHKGCIEKWLAEKPNCPTCQTKVDLSAVRGGQANLAGGAAQPANTNPHYHDDSGSDDDFDADHNQNQQNNNTGHQNEWDDYSNIGAQSSTSSGRASNHHGQSHGNANADGMTDEQFAKFLQDQEYNGGGGDGGPNLHQNVEWEQWEDYSHYGAQNPAINRGIPASNPGQNHRNRNAITDEEEYLQQLQAQEYSGGDSLMEYYQMLADRGELGR